MEIGRALQNEIHISLNLDLKDEQEAALAGLVALHAVRYAIGGGGDGDDLFPEEMMAIQSVVEKSAFGLDELRQKMAALSETQDGWMAIHLEELIGEFIDDPCKSTLQRIRLEGVKAMKAVGVVLF